MNIEHYRTAKLIREFEQLLLRLFGEGKLNGTVHTCVGQELVPVLLSDHIIEADTFFSNHRGHGHYICKTRDVKGLLAEIMGRQSGCSGGYGGSQHLFSEKSFYSNGIQGGMSPIAAGYAFSKKISGKKGISVQFIGDGTLGEGTLYEAFNFCAIYKLPVLFVLENNGYAQSTSSRQTFKGSTQKRFEGFGLKYFKGSIWNPDDLSGEFGKAVACARNGEPAIIEVECYRLNSHSKSDDNRNPEEINQHLEKDLLSQFEKKNPAETRSATNDVQTLLRQTLAAVEKETILEFPAEEVKEHETDVTFIELQPSADEVRINDVIYQAFKKLFNENEGAVLIGEDIENSNDFNPRPYGGAFKVTRDLSNLFCKVYNTPISEAAITGMAIGLALEGKLAIAEIMFGDFVTLVMDQVLQHASKFRGMYGRKLPLPFILRTPMGGRRGYGPTHSQSLEKHFLGIYGIQVLALNYRVHPGDLYTRLFSNNDGPCIVIENKIDYTRYVNTPFIPTHEYFVSREIFPVLKITPKQLSPALTVLCYGGTLADAEAAAQELFIEHEVPVEIICPTCIHPFNLTPLQQSVQKTGRLLTIEEGNSFAGFGSEAIAQLITRGTRITRAAQMGNQSIIPGSYLAEMNLLPDKQKIVSTILKM